MRAHDILTEGSLRAHDRKGREGNREGKGNGFVNSHPYVTVGAALVMDGGQAAVFGGGC